MVWLTTKPKKRKRKFKSLEEWEKRLQDVPNEQIAQALEKEYP